MRGHRSNRFIHPTMMFATQVFVFLVVSGLSVRIRGQTTEQADMRSRFTRDGRCSYTFVLPPSHDRTCGSGHDLRTREELQQVSETVEQQQGAVRHMQGELERLARQADDVEGRVMLLEGKPSSLLWEEVLRLQKQNQALAGQVLDQQGVQEMVQQLRRQNEFLQSTHHVMEQRVLALESRPSNMLWDEVKRLQQQNQAILQEMEDLREGKSRKPSKHGRDRSPTTPRIIGPRDVQDQDADSEDGVVDATPQSREKRLLTLEGMSASELREEVQQLYGQLRDQDEILDEVERLTLQNSELERSQQFLQRRLSGVLGESEASSPQSRDLPGWNTSSEGCQSCGDALPASCTEVSETLGESFRSGDIYAIDPDGPGQGVPPTPVQCERVGDAVASSFGHDSEARTAVEGYRDPGSYSRNVTYWTSLEQIRAVIRRSKRCMQFIKYECLSSVLHRDSTSFAWWVSADGRRKDYWGGGKPGTSNCACGQTGTCGGGRACKCDLGLASWQEDSGWLMHKRHLPVTQLRFGDTGTPGQQGYHTLGRLICF
ncbi:uncharacterized protein LOC144917227 isoform X1 [Branchiostoma floridae x Branchiostoma belcheri]